MHAQKVGQRAGILAPAQGSGIAVTVGAVRRKELRRCFASFEVLLRRRGPGAEACTRHDQCCEKPSSKQIRLLRTLGTR